jgi:hypothetical protein
VTDLSFPARVVGRVAPELCKRKGPGEDGAMGLQSFRFLALSVLPVLVGCVPTLANRVPDSKIVMSRMMVLPAMTMASELDFFDKNQFDDKRADALFAVINPEVQGQATRKGGFSLPVEKVNACGKRCVRLVIDLVRWGLGASMEIAEQMYQVRNYKADSIAEWQLWGDFTPLRQATGADYVLFVVMRDLRETPGRMITMALGGGRTRFKQVGVACVVDLTKQHMVWCHAKSDAWINLRDPVEAHSAVAELLSDLTP